MEIPYVFLNKEILNIWQKNPQNKTKQNKKKTQLEYLVFSVHAMLKLSMQDFEYNLTSMEDECNCPVV